MAGTLHPAMCRLCLQSEAEACTVSIFSVANGYVIAEIARHCLGIAIVKDSTPYENVCSPCIVSLVSMYELYLKYQACNRAFLEMFFETHQLHLPHQSNEEEGGELGDTVELPGDVTTRPASAGSLYDIIEEDYSISDDSEEHSSSGLCLLKGTAEPHFDEPVYYVMDDGVYVRTVVGMDDGLLHGSLEHQSEAQHTNEPAWNHTETLSDNASLMEEFNAQVARLDSQESANLTATEGDQPPSPVLKPSAPAPEMCADRVFLKDCQNVESAEGDDKNWQTNSTMGPEGEGEETRYQEPVLHHCYICGASFQTCVELVNHFPAHFLDVPRECTLCGTEQRTVINLNRHLAYHKPDRPYKCDRCERRFGDPLTFKWHTSEFHARQTSERTGAEGTTSHALVCDICGKSYILAEPFEQHVQQHEQGHQQQYRCKLCDRSFPRNIYLLFHLETHAKQRPHRCQYCSLPFASQYLKDFHEKRHPVGESGGGGGPIAAHRCPLCLTLCRTKHRLLAHIEAFHPADTRIQLLQCSFNDCRLQFLDLNEFQGHITDHRVGDRFPCTHCPRVFMRQRRLYTHLRTVHGLSVEAEASRSKGLQGSSFRCDTCTKSFRSERTYQLHLVQSHQDGALPEDT